MTWFGQNAAAYSCELVFLYGSWTSGRQRFDSDVDLAILFSEDAGSEEEVYRMVADIGVELGAILCREVNIIELHWSFDRPMLYYNATVHGVPLFVRDESKCSGFVREAVAQMEDFIIFGVGWQLRAARRNVRKVIHA
jgi:predicted nucleotidyltransferase